MSRIRVLQIVPGIAIGEHSGGAELYAIQISRLLSKATFDPAVFVMTHFGSHSEEAWRSKLTAQGITIGGLILPNSSLTTFLSNVFQSLWKFTTKFRPDIINSHTERGDLLNSLIHLFHPIHPRSVRTVHIDKQWVTHPKVGAVLNKAFFPLVINAETAVSATIINQLNNRPIARFLRKDATKIHNGIDESYFTSPPGTIVTAPIPAGVPDVKPKIGIIGRLTDQKGHADLLVAFNIIKEKFQAHLLIIGAGPLESNLKQLTHELGIQDRVDLLGNRKDVMDILPHLDLVVSASLWEGFPTVLLEAMSQEVPVIATNISGSCELIKSGITGVLVPPADPHTLAEAIMRLLSDPAKAEEMGKSARVYASQFTVQNTTKYHSKLYQELTTS